MALKLAEELKLITGPTSHLQMSQYPQLMKSLLRLSSTQKASALRRMARTDLYFLLRYIMQRSDVENPWLFDRIREVQNNPNGYLDLWSREHYKSTIQTYAKTIQDILASHGEDPIISRPLTFGIFSHTRPIAKKFLSQIKREFESNEWLKELFPDIIWKNPYRESQKWSEDAGLILRRETNPKEATVEAWGVVDGQPTAVHFDVLIYDDVVTEASISSPDMIEKTTKQLANSYNLGARGGVKRAIGTRWHANDTYREVIKRKTFVPRLHAATDTGKLDGKAVFLDQKEFEQKVQDMGIYVASCQLLMNPVADKMQGFRREWLRFYQGNLDGSGMNVYLLCDPANEKKKSSDYTSIVVIGLNHDHNYYLLDAVYDRLDLEERTKAFIAMHKRWRPLKTGYEKYGKDSDIQHIKYVQKQINYRFDIAEVGGSMQKNDRIRRLVPIFGAGRFYLPDCLFRTNYKNETIDIIEQYLNEEYDPFPVPVHDDMFDNIARIVDPSFNAIFPKLRIKEPYRNKSTRAGGGNWMSY